MMYIAGIDIGNATTEVAVGKFENGDLERVESGIAATTGLKGTVDNISGIRSALKAACRSMGITVEDVSRIRLNEATPVIGDFAMETITETIITESTMIGHDPDTPGGSGLACGYTIAVGDLSAAVPGEEYIAVASEEFSFREVVEAVKDAIDSGVSVTGIILQRDDGVLVSNRLPGSIPVVDEVRYIDKIPEHVLCAVEVADKGTSVETLSNPYGIASLFDLTPEETKHVMYIAKALIGNRSAVVLRTPRGEVKERVIPAGEICFHGANRERSADLQEGAEKIMQAQEKAGELSDVSGSRGTNIGGMLASIRRKMATITEMPEDGIRIQDIKAVDTLVPRRITGGMANEFSMEKSVAIAAMVKTERLNMEKVASYIEEKTGIETGIGGVEGDMAAIGALTTPGISTPILVVDIGAGSTDACLYGEDGTTDTIHLAGAGDMVTALIRSELGLSSFDEAEDIKKFKLVRVENLFQIRYEDGSTEFFRQPLPGRLFAKTVLVKNGEFVPLETREPMEKIRRVRRDVKRKVLVTNVLRAMRKVTPGGNIHGLSNVVLLGGSSLDLEFANMLTQELSYYGITAGKAQVRGCEGPRNAVATGLLLTAAKELAEG